MSKFVRNVSPMMTVFNLPKKDGKRPALYLSPREISRALTEEEFGCMEIQKGLENKKLFDVTSKVS